MGSRLATLRGGRKPFQGVEETTMRRKGLLAVIALGAVSLALVGWTQDTNQNTKTGRGKQLIAWTQDQQARPLPQTQTPSTPTQQAPSAGQNVEKEPAAQAFMGMIMKSGGTYVLQTA